MPPGKPFEPGLLKINFVAFFFILSLEPKHSPSQIHFKLTFCWLHNILKYKYVILPLIIPVAGHLGCS